MITENRGSDEVTDSARTYIAHDIFKLWVKELSGGPLENFKLSIDLMAKRAVIAADALVNELTKDNS